MNGVLESFLRLLTVDGIDHGQQLQSLSAMVNIVLSMFSGFLIFWVYKLVLRRPMSSSLALTIPVLSVLMTVLMKMPGGQVAAFFGIFGVLSIVRFRSFNVDLSDVTFILFGVVNGVLFGVNAYLLAVVTFVVISFGTYVFSRIVHARERMEEVVVQVEADLPYEYIKNQCEVLFQQKGILYRLLVVEASFKKDDRKGKNEKFWLVEYQIFVENGTALKEVYESLLAAFGDSQASVLIKGKP